MLTASEALGYVVVVVDAPVAQERPPAPDLFAVVEVQLHHYALLVGVGRFVENLALWTGNG